MPAVPVPSGGRSAGAAPKPAVVKTTVTGQGSTHAAAKAQAVAALGKMSTPKNAAAPARKQAAAQAFDPVNATHQQIQQFAQRITHGAAQAQLIPLRQQAAMLNNAENTASTRYGGYAQTEQGVLSGLQSDMQNTALTNENVQAQQAQATANAIDKSGAAAAALNGGYMGPTAQAAQGQAAQYLGTTAGAQSGYLAGQMGNNAALLNTLRGTAALQAQEGQANIASQYAKLRGQNQAQAQQVIAKLPGATAGEEAALVQQQFQDRAIAKEYGLKKYTAVTDRQRVIDAYRLGVGRNNISAFQAKTARLNAGTTATYDAARTQLQAAGLTEKTTNDAATQAIHRTLARAQIRHQQAQDKIAQIRAQLAQTNVNSEVAHRLNQDLQGWLRVANQTAPSSKTTKASATTAGIISGAAYWYQRQVAELSKVKDKTTGKPLSPAAIREQASGAVAKRFARYGPASQAAVQLATDGYVHGAVLGQLKAIGVILPPVMTTPPKGGKNDLLSGLPKVANSVVGAAVAGSK